MLFCACVWIVHVCAYCVDHIACYWCMFEICCVLQGMISGYPPVLPPLQGPVDGIVSMGSMQPLHPGVPPPHQLPPGMPGIPGIPPPGKSLILIPPWFHCHVLGLTHSYRSSLQLVLLVPLVCQHCWIWGVCRALAQLHVPWALRIRVLEKCGAAPAGVLFQPK